MSSFHASLPCIEDCLWFICFYPVHINNTALYVGYRYFETFAKEKVLYPFGYGLSYTSFEIKSQMELEEDAYIFYIHVKNTAKFAAKEVILPSSYQ